MKRYKQAFLSNFFITPQRGGLRHLVEANLDIEARSDLALCTEVLVSCDEGYELLEPNHLQNVCPICQAILSRRFDQQPIERTVRPKPEVKPVVCDSQLSLLSMMLEDESSPIQMELFFHKAASS